MIHVGCQHITALSIMMIRLLQITGGVPLSRLTCVRHCLTLILADRKCSTPNFYCIKIFEHIAELGDFDPELHEHDYISNFKFIPEQVGCIDCYLSYLGYSIL